MEVSGWFSEEGQPSASSAIRFDCVKPHRATT